MTNRARIKNTLLGRDTDRAPSFQLLGLWEETERRWHEQGLGSRERWEERAGFDPGIRDITDFSQEGSVKITLWPFFEPEVLEDKGETVIVRDILGIVKEDRKDGLSFPRYIRHPVQTPEDWEQIKKERFNPHDPTRFPVNFNELAETYNAGEEFIQIGGYPMGLFGTCRDLMGTVEFLEAFYTMPELVHDMMEYLTDFWITVYREIVKKVKVDSVHIWEDMSGVSGSLLSPQMVREFMVPNYRKIRDFCDENGIEILSLDTDGDVSQLIEPFMEGGINVLLPFETVSKYTLLDIRKAYPTLGIIGGIDKKEIAKGREAIDRELEKTREMLRYGRYVPSLDHAAHPDISFEDFLYYAERLMELVKTPALWRGGTV